VTLKERWAAFSPRERYLMLGSVATAVVVVLRYAPIPAIGNLSFSGNSEDWVQLQKIENYQKILSRSDAAERTEGELKRRYAAAQARLLAGTTPTQVGAELQGALSSMAGVAGLNVLSSQILKEEEDRGFRRVGVRLTLSGDLEGVVDMLSAIETGKSDIQVTQLEINRKLGASRRPTPSRPTTSSRSSVSNQALTATMEVKTFMQSTL
jgi:hypothetical protein